MTGRNSAATDAAIATFKLGTSVTLAAGLHGIAPSTLGRALKRLGIALPLRGWPNGKARKPKP